jgi:predicted ArsR family transcriptional regulator
MIEAKNCVYHELARAHPEVCQFDLELLSRFMGMDVTQEECMLRGGQSCRFRFLKQTPDDRAEMQAEAPARLAGE